MSALDDIRNAIGSSELASELMVAATLTTVREGAYNSSDPSAGSSKTTTTYPCRAVTSKYGGKFRKPGEARDNSFIATIMLAGNAALVGVDVKQGDLISIPPPGRTTPINARIVKIREVDAAGATVTVDCQGP